MCKRGSDVQVAAEHGLQQIVTVNFADEGAGSLVNHIPMKLSDRWGKALVFVRESQKQ